MRFTSALRWSALGQTHPLQDGRNIARTGCKLVFLCRLVGAAGVRPGVWSSPLLCWWNEPSCPSRAPAWNSCSVCITWSEKGGLQNNKNNKGNPKEKLKVLERRQRNLLLTSVSPAVALSIMPICISSLLVNTSKNGSPAGITQNPVNSKKILKCRKLKRFPVS